MHNYISQDFEIAGSLPEIFKSECYFPVEKLVKAVEKTWKLGRTLNDKQNLFNKVLPVLS